MVIVEKTFVSNILGNFGQNFRVRNWNYAKIFGHLLEYTKRYQRLSKIFQKCCKNCKQWNIIIIFVRIKFDTKKWQLFTIFKIQIQFYLDQMFQNQMNSAQPSQIRFDIFQIKIAILKADFLFRIIQFHLFIHCVH